MPFKFNAFTGTFDIVNTAISNPLLFKGNIAANADFPLLANVQIGWFYTVSASVTDNVALHTNTGQSFISGDEIAWNGTNWTLLGNSSLPGGDVGSVQFNNSGSFGGFGSWDGSKLVLPGDLVISADNNNSIDIAQTTNNNLYLSTGLYVYGNGKVIPNAEVFPELVYEEGEDTYPNIPVFRVRPYYNINGVKVVSENYNDISIGDGETGMSGNSYIIWDDEETVGCDGFSISYSNPDGDPSWNENTFSVIGNGNCWVITGSCPEGYTNFVQSDVSIPALNNSIGYNIRNQINGTMAGNTQFENIALNNLFANEGITVKGGQGGYKLSNPSLNWEGQQTTDFTVLNYIASSLLLGQDAGNDTLSGSGNVIFQTAGRSLTFGSNNVLFPFTGGSLTGGQQNVFIGNRAGDGATNPTANIGIGISSLYRNNQSYNIGIGDGTLQANENGQYLTAIGYNALTNLESGNNIVAIGSYAGFPIHDLEDSTILFDAVSREGTIKTGEQEPFYFVANSIVANQYGSINGKMRINGIDSLGDVSVYGSSSRGTEKLFNNSFTSNANGWSLTGDASYYSGQINFYPNGGTLTQASANMTTPLVVGELYELIINGNYGGQDDQILDVSVAGNTLPRKHIYNNTGSEKPTYIFKALNTNSLVITVSGNTGAFWIYGVSLKKVLDGHLTVGGLLRSNGVVNNYVAVSTTYSVLTTDYTVNCTANSFTVTLPTATTTGQVFNIKNSGTGVITINTTSSQTIDGVASGATTLAQYENLTVQSNGVNWIIL